MNELTTY